MAFAVGGCGQVGQIQPLEALKGEVFPGFAFIFGISAFQQKILAIAMLGQPHHQPAPGRCKASVNGRELVRSRGNLDHRFKLPAGPIKAAHGDDLFFRRSDPTEHRDVILIDDPHRINAGHHLRDLRDRLTTVLNMAEIQVIALPGFPVRFFTEP